MTTVGVSTHWRTICLLNLCLSKVCLSSDQVKTIFFRGHMTYPEGRMRGAGAPKWQSLRERVVVWYLNGQSQLNAICMNYSGLHWHFVLRGQFGIKDWFSWGRVTLMGWCGCHSDWGCSWSVAASKNVTLAMHSTSQPGGGCAASCTACMPAGELPGENLCLIFEFRA